MKSKEKNPPLDARSCSADHQISHLLWNTNFHYSVHKKSCHFFPVLSQINPSTPLHHVSSRSVLILSSPCTSASPKRSLFSHVLKPECCTHLSLLHFMLCFPPISFLICFALFLRPNSFVLVDKTNFPLYCPSRSQGRPYILAALLRCKWWEISFFISVLDLIEFGLLIRQVSNWQKPVLLS